MIYLSCNGLIQALFFASSLFAQDIFIHHDAGRHDIRFDASNLAGGVYIYKIQAGDFAESKSMLISSTLCGFFSGH